MDAKLWCYTDTVSKMMALKSELSRLSSKELQRKMLQMAELVPDKFFSGTFHALNAKGARENHEGCRQNFFQEKGASHMKR